MKKIFVAALLLLCAYAAQAQNRYITRNGHIWIYSKTPLEKIEAHNNQVAGVLDASTGAMAFDVVMRSFKFEKALMEEHFNENYAESAKYPKSSFKGKVTNINQVNFKKDGSYDAVVEGDLTIHGVTKKVKHSGTITISGNQAYGKTKFTITPQDYNIQIPSLVKDKIAKVIDINVDVKFDKQGK
ncbi:MAG: YceI family protein [Chloroflexota bacterium]